MSPLFLLGIAVLLVLANGFFVAVEFALMAARRGLIEEMAEEELFGARSALAGMRTINVQLAASQLGISVVSLVLGWLVEPVVGGAFRSLFDQTKLPSAWSGALSLILGLVIVAFFHMVVGEMMPKSFALATPERTARLLMPFHMVVVKVVRPVVRLLHALARLGTRAVGVEPIDELSQSHTATELALMVEEAHAGGQLARNEHDLLVGAFSFLSVCVRDVMAPASELATVPHTATVDEAERIMVESGHSRLLVMGDGPDQVIGFLHAKDLIQLPATASRALLPSGIVRVALRAGPDDLLEVLLPRMRHARRHVAAVLDDGHLVGLVTLEDILEAIVGDIEDESDVRSGEVAVAGIVDAEADMDGGTDR
ncbi:MAG TPA: hemolysin family protein [Microthrixaceae bacterium]|nr:hemolysin family protein [Microthrixaceae bacterium]